jgi:hypothetical protein
MDVENEQNLSQNKRLHSPDLTLSDPMSDLARHYDFPVPDAFPDL